MLNKYNFIGFYHEYEEYGCFSNWYAAEFEYAGKKYANSEQFMMYQKAMVFSQYDLADQIMATNDPQECKNLGKTTFSNWDGDFWDKVSYPIVKRGVKAKFVQNPDIRRELLMTENALLAECSKNDTKWGIGIDIEDDRRFNVSEWNGKNYLGRILMEVRDELRTISYMAPGNRAIEYRDAREMRPIEEWEMTIDELLRIPKFRKVISDYVDIVGKICGNNIRSKILKDSPAHIEDMQRSNMGGGLPYQGFWEMKQDFYDTAKNMWILASGFDAPAYGKPLPEGAKLEKQENGTYKIVIPEEEA